MKTTRHLKLFLVLFLFGMAFQNVKAQVATVTDLAINKKSYWQLSSRVGYDFPTYKEDFKYIEYKGGVMGGLSLNRYWNHWGFQADFDYIKNAPKSTLPNPLPYIGGPAGFVQMNTTTQSTDITRMFFGVGPAYKYQSQSDKWTTEASVLGGISIINGGEILVQGSNKIVGGTVAPHNLGSPVLLTYHSGFNQEKAMTFKAQIRETYWFKGDKWGVNVGAYYMNHFGVNESKVNPLLISNGYVANNDTGNLYYYQVGTFSTSQINNGEPVFGENQEIRTQFDGVDQQQKIKLSSVGVFAGVSYRFLPRKKAKAEEKVVEKVAPPVEKKYCIQVTAKDKFTNEILPNTDVALKNSKGEIVGTAKTDAFGVTKFCDILADDYTLAGVLNETALDGNVAKKSEFKEEQTLLKDLIYSDRNFIVKGKAVECNTTTPISGITVVLENIEKAFKKTTVTDDKGNFVLQLPEAGVYSLYGKKESYLSQTEEVTASNYSREKTLFVKLEICAEKVDCGKGLGLKNVLFDLNKYIIKEDSKIELNRLVRFMQDNPDVKVEVGSHTDCRSSSVYNQKLSQNRANASVDYVVSQGISRDRITGKGYGESKLLNECADGVKCSEEQHAINRRTEMKVICPEKK
jgi:outer membrane protein OmpA-like peptidoglycan-associated protein